MKTDKTTPWKISTNRYVGYVDIMGFKDMLTRLSHKKVYNLMKKVSESVRSLAVFAIDESSEDDFDINLKMILFSDSIIIYTRDNEPLSLENLFISISELSNSLFSLGIPHKGAIAFGLMTSDPDNSIFFGQPLVDAYLLQEELKFYGIAVHGTVEKNEDILNEVDFYDVSIIEYDCPLKNGSAKHLTVVPDVSLNEKFEEERVDDLIEKVFKMRKNTSGSLRKYIDNTIEYLDAVKKEGLQKLKEEEEEESLNEE